MPELLFEPSADASLTTLEGDPGREKILGKVQAALRQLALDPGDARCRRRSYQQFGWGMPIRTEAEDWLVLWRAGEAGEVIIRYIGPDL